MKILKKLSTLTLVFSFVFGFTGPINARAAGPAGVNLGSAGDFVILGKTGISTTGTTAVTGDIGVSPAAATYITGFGLTMDSSNTFSKSSLVNGKVYASDYTAPTPDKMTTAISNMEAAYTDAAGRTNPTAIELGAGNIGGLTLTPGIYKWGTDVIIPTDVILSGGANDVWIFQIAQNLSVSSSAHVVLIGGAKAANIFWQVAGQTTLGTTSVFNGNILDQTAIVLNTGAVLNGRALAQSAVTLDANSVNFPSAVVVTPIPVVTPISVTTLTPNASPTSTVAQSTTPVTLNVAPEVTMTTISTGCSGGNKFNTSTGQLCENNTSPSVLTTVSAPAKVSYNFGTMTLKNGSKGNAVMELQRFLNAKLNLGLVVDGKLGLKTVAIIKKWQKDNGLVADGLIGAKTKAKMNAEVN